MFKLLFRTLMVLLVAGTLAGGVYAMSNTSLVQSAILTSFEHRPDQFESVSGDQPDSNAGEAFEPVERIERMPPEDLPVWFRFAGLLGHSLVLALIIAVVAFGQKLLAWTSIKLKTRVRVKTAA